MAISTWRSDFVHWMTLLYEGIRYLAKRILTTEIPESKLALIHLLNASLKLVGADAIIFLELSKLEDLLAKPVDTLTDIECWPMFFKYVTDKSKRDLLNKITKKEANRLPFWFIVST